MRDFRIDRRRLLQGFDCGFACGARIIGVNNRNLETFEVSLETSFDLIKHRTDDTRFISESGLTTREDLVRLSDAGFDAFLIGESLMRAADIEIALGKLL